MVLLFLGVLSHALAVYMRADDFVLDYEVRQRTRHFFINRTSDSIIQVNGFFRRREALVGKRHEIPVMLVIAEVCAIIASITVLGNFIRLPWIRRKFRKYPEVLDSQEDTAPEFWFS